MKINYIIQHALYPHPHLSFQSLGLYKSVILRLRFVTNLKRSELIACKIILYTNFLTLPHTSLFSQAYTTEKGFPAH